MATRDHVIIILNMGGARLHGIYIVRIRNLREYLHKTESLVASCQFYARLEGSVEVKSFICRYGPVDCAQAVKGEGLTVGKGVKSTHSDPGWLVL